MSATTKPLVYDGNTLLRLLETQLGMYRELRSLGQRQRKVIASPDGEALLKIVGMRQRLVNELMRINRHLAPIKEDWMQVRSNLSQEERERAEALVSAVREELSGILRADQKDCQSLSARQRTSSREMASLSSTRRALSAYGPGTVSREDSRYVDQTDQQG